MNKMAYWHYYLTIEKDLIDASKYIEISLHNKKIFSIAFTRIILCSCSEIDVMCRLLSGSTKEWVKMEEHCRKLPKQYPKIQSMEPFILGTELKQIPWGTWKEQKIPQWWHDYADIKHRRHVNFKKANLENTLDALCALFCLNIVFYETQYSLTHHVLTPKSNLFSFDPTLALRASGGTRDRKDEIKWSYEI